MIKTKMYRYLGRNGIITSPIFVEKAEPLIMYELYADYGKVMTNGSRFAKVVTVFEDELQDWAEVDNIVQEKISGNTDKSNK